MKYMYPWAVPDPDLKIRGGKGARSSRPFDKRGGGGLQKKLFSALRASVWSKNKGGWAGPPGPLPWFRHSPKELLYSSH